MTYFVIYFKFMRFEELTRNKRCKMIHVKALADIICASSASPHCSSNSLSPSEYCSEGVASHFFLSWQGVSCHWYCQNCAKYLDSLSIFLTLIPVVSQKLFLLIFISSNSGLKLNRQFRTGARSAAEKSENLQGDFIRLSTYIKTLYCLGRASQNSGFVFSEGICGYKFNKSQRLTMDVISIKEIQTGGKGIRADKFNTDVLLFLRNVEADRWAPEV